MENPSYYAILTANVRYDKRLKPMEKLIFAELTALTHKEGYCWATNGYFAKLYETAKTTVSKWLAHLQECGFIKISLSSTYENGRRITILQEQNDNGIKQNDNGVDQNDNGVDQNDNGIDQNDNGIDQNDNGIDQNDNTPIDQKVNTPHDQKVNPPIDQNVNQIVQESNTIKFNNINNNSSCCCSSSDLKINPTQQQSQLQQLSKTYQDNIGTVSPTIRKEIKYYLDKGIEYLAIDYAIKKAVFGGTDTANWRYIRAILLKWDKSKIYTLEQAQSEQLQHSKPLSQPQYRAGMSVSAFAKNTSASASYDIDEIERMITYGN